MAIVRFADNVNMSEAIRNAATVPGTASNGADGTAFVAFLLHPRPKRFCKTPASRRWCRRFARE